MKRIPEICDPRRTSHEEAVRMARKGLTEHKSFEAELFQFLNEHLRCVQVNVEIVARTLDVLGEIAAPARLFVAVRATMSSSDPHVRSKSALCLGRHLDSTQWMLKLATDSDDRVRANTIESFWGRPGPDPERILLGALSDANHRVVANAAYGLLLIDAARHIAKVEALLVHHKPAHRSAGAWILGKVGDPRYISLLRPLLLDKDESARRAGFRALAKIRAANAAVA